jgi:hypothetical protein
VGRQKSKQKPGQKWPGFFMRRASAQGEHHGNPSEKYTESIYFIHKTFRFWALGLARAEDIYA